MQERAMRFQEVTFASGAGKLSPWATAGMVIGAQVAQSSPASIGTVGMGTKVHRGVDLMRAPSGAPPQAASPMRPGGRGAIQGIRAGRTRRWRTTRWPRACLPTPCKSRWARAMPRTRRGGGHWSRLLWLPGFTALALMLAHCSRSAPGAGPFHYDPSPHSASFSQRQRACAAPFHAAGCWRKPAWIHDPHRRGTRPKRQI